MDWAGGGGWEELTGETADVGVDAEGECDNDDDCEGSEGSGKYD